MLSTSGISAETNADGPVVNVIPKEGGNTFSGTIAGFFANDGLESSNLTQELRAQGLTTSNRPRSSGTSWRAWAGRSRRTTCGSLSPLGAGAHAEQACVLEQDAGYVPHAARGGAQGGAVHALTDRGPRDRSSGRWEWYDSYLNRITWQAAAKHKANFT